VIQSIVPQVIFSTPLFLLTKGNSEAEDLLPIPDRLVVLTFDDGNKSDITYTVPLLKRYGFSATFYVTEGLDVLIDKEHRLTWEEIRKLHEDGFEIGNHTGATIPISYHSAKSRYWTKWNIWRSAARKMVFPSQRPLPIPAAITTESLSGFLKIWDTLYARRGAEPEYPIIPDGSRGPVYAPEEDHPLLVPSTTVSGPNLDFQDLV